MLYNAFFVLTVNVSANPCSTTTLVTGSPVLIYTYNIDDPILKVSFNYFTWAPVACTTAIFAFTVDGSGVIPSFISFNTISKTFDI